MKDLLTSDELKFLALQGYGADDVFDARGMSSRRWKAEVRAAGKTMVLGAACQAGGHRLRTRSGHCVQCDTSKLAFQNRFRSPGYIYIAGSLRARVVKIGTASDIPQRERNLRAQSYGGIGDWEILFYVVVGEGGASEHAARKLLRNFVQVRSFVKDESIVDASEVLGCPFSTAREAVASVIGEKVVARGWMSRRVGEYEFQK